MVTGTTERGRGQGPGAGERQAYLDWLRFLVVLSLAPFHAALSYTGIGVVYVYDDPVRNAILAGGPLYGRFGPPALALFTVFMDNWFMHLLFLVSGIGAAVALRARSRRAFIDERARRLLWPLLLITLTVIPVQAWFRALDFGTFSGGLIAFYLHFFDGIYAGPGSSGNFEYGHLWFLAYLFVFSMIALPLFEHWRIAGRRLWPGGARGAWILAPALGIGALEAVFRPGWPGFQNLINDWANFSVYLSFFVLGYVLGTNPELAAAAERNRYAALVLGAIAFFARRCVYFVLAPAGGYHAANMLGQGFRGIAAWALVVAAIGFGRRHLNRTGRLYRAARDLSFPLYLLHLAPVTAATFWLLPTPLGVWPRWAISVAAAWLTVALCAFAFRFVPPLRSFFGIGAPAPVSPAAMRRDSRPVP
jgi:glucans biosynthesis protein C